MKLLIAVGLCLLVSLCAPAAAHKSVVHPHHQHHWNHHGGPMHYGTGPIISVPAKPAQHGPIIVSQSLLKPLLSASLSQSAEFKPLVKPAASALVPLVKPEPMVWRRATASLQELPIAAHGEHVYKVCFPVDAVPKSSSDAFELVLSLQFARSDRHRWSWQWARPGDAQENFDTRTVTPRRISRIGVMLHHEHENRHGFRASDLRSGNIQLTIVTSSKITRVQGLIGAPGLHHIRSRTCPRYGNSHSSHSSSSSSSSSNNHNSHHHYSHGIWTSFIIRMVFWAAILPLAVGIVSICCCSASQRRNRLREQRRKKAAAAAAAKKEEEEENAFEFVDIDSTPSATTTTAATAVQQPYPAMTLADGARTVNGVTYVPVPVYYPQYPAAGQPFVPQQAPMRPFVQPLPQQQQPQQQQQPAPQPTYSNLYPNLGN